MDHAPSQLLNRQHAALQTGTGYPRDGFQDPQLQKSKLTNEGDLPTETLADFTPSISEHRVIICGIIIIN